MIMRTDIREFRNRMHARSMFSCGLVVGVIVGVALVLIGTTISRWL